MDYLTITIYVLIGILTFTASVAYSNTPKGINWIKYIKARLWIRSYKKKFEKKFIYKRVLKNDVSPYDVGLIPSPLEYEAENPNKILDTQYDGIHFCGFNFEKNYLDLSIKRIEDNLAIVWILLKLSDDQIYRLPISKDTRKYFIYREHAFYSSGLQIKCLEPFRKWRISFNGLLQKCTTEKKLETPQMIHIKFSFVWHAMSVVLEQNIDLDFENLARAFAKTSHVLSSEDFEKFYKLQNRYEQWGQLMGTVHVKGKPEQEMFLWSNRTRMRDFPAPFENLSVMKLFMYFQDGFPLKIENMTVENLLSDYTNGYTINDLGSAKELRDCNFTSDLLHANSSTANLSFKISGLKDKLKKSLTVNFTGEEEILDIGARLEQSIILKPFTALLSNGDYGFGILHIVKRSMQNSAIDFVLPPIVLKGVGKEYPKIPVILLSDEKCKSSSLAGGKGSSLSFLTSLALKSFLFDVPRGFVITTSAFDTHIESNPSVSYAIQRVINVSCGKSLGDLKEECLKCTKEFQTSKLSESLKREIEATLSHLYDKMDSSLRFSVRSSACDEDCEDYSAAGQMLTVLGVSGLENILKAVIECWSSKFRFEAIQYTRQNGLLIRSSMAVVVQEMIPSEVSGVLFTVDPVTGDPSRPHITANYGLGETIVSSLAEPDTIVLKRAQGFVELETKIIGAKQTRIDMKETNGTEQKTSDIDVCCGVCLNDDLAIKIGSVGILVEDCFCIPQDIEWAWYRNKLFLLQARPITTLHNETEFEMIHDQDTPIRSDHEFWTRANLGEVYLGATSPLGISLGIAQMDIYGLRNRFMREMIPPKDFCPYNFHTLPITHRQATLNIIDVLFRVNDKKQTAYQKAFEVSLFGRLIGTEEMHKVGVKKYGYMSRWQSLIGIPYILILFYLVPKWAKDYEKKICEYQLPLETYTTIKKTWEGLLSQLKFISEVSNLHGMSTFSSSYYNLWVLTILSRKRKEWDSTLYCDFSTLLSTCSDIESANVPESLQDLARIIAKHHGLTFSSLPANIAYNLLENDCGLPGVLFKEFIRKHGHRCIKEFDPYSISWRMNPESLIPLLQNIVKSPNVLQEKIRSEETIDSFISKVNSPLSIFDKKVLKIVLPLSRNAVRRREKSKSMVIKAVDWLRQTCYQLGELMVQEGMLPSNDLLFFLTLGEINQMIRERKSGFVSKAIRRKRLHPKLDSLQFPEIIRGIPKPITEEDASSSFSTSFTLTGTPVCHGKIKATARVVKSLEEVSSIQSGDVLITHSTDVGWTPYFPLLSGVVTVLGGLISHGAVVAREYGLPCIVGVQNAMSTFKSGDIVILDGTKGTITKVINNADSIENIE